MVEDIQKLHLKKEIIQRGVDLVGFIYSHFSTLSLLKHFTKKRKLVRHVVTRFATSFLSLEILYIKMFFFFLKKKERLHQEKRNLRKIFTSNYEWSKNKLSKLRGRQATKVVLMPSFLNHVVFTLNFMRGSSCLSTLFFKGSKRLGISTFLDFFPPSFWEIRNDEPE